MKFTSSAAFLSSIAAASAAASICDTYTAALFKTKGGNTAANQETLLTLVVNTAVIGNYTTPNVGIAVPGLLNPGVYNGQQVNLLPYFNGALASTNNGGQCGVSMNFLDGGGAAPLMMNMPADNPNTAQYTLLTHLYEFFASLLGCSMYGNTVSPYAGSPSMYEVHKFMALSDAEVGWFIQNVGLSAASFGVASADVTAVGTALMTLFGYRCEPEEVIPPVQGPWLQSICTDCDCPLSPNADCSLYGPVIQPQPASSASSWCGSSEWESCQEWCGTGGWGGWGSPPATSPAAPPPPATAAPPPAAPSWDGSGGWGGWKRVKA